jgi:hypothetical protein
VRVDDLPDRVAAVRAKIEDGEVAFLVEVSEPVDDGAFSRVSPIPGLGVMPISDTLWAWLTLPLSSTEDVCANLLLWSDAIVRVSPLVSS